MLTIRTSQNHTRFNLQAITNLEYIHLEFMLLHLDLFKDSWWCVFRKRNWYLIKLQGQDTTPSPKPSRLPSFGVWLVSIFLSFAWSKLWNRKGEIKIRRENTDVSERTIALDEIEMNWLGFISSWVRLSQLSYSWDNSLFRTGNWVRSRVILLTKIDHQFVWKALNNKKIKIDNKPLHGDYWLRKPTATLTGKN